MPIAAGDVYRLWDRFTRPPKQKRALCVCPERRLFLRINSRPTFPPHLLVRADEADFLDHDSFLELQRLVRYYESDVSAATRLGRVTETLARRICLAADASPALTPDQKALVRDRLWPG